MSAVPGSGRVDRAAIEAKLRQIRGEVDETTQSAKPVVFAVGAAVAVAIVAGAFLLGRRSGKKRSAVVEIRRV